MLSKVICIFVVVAVAHSAPQHESAARYPAGVNPSLCPGYPICDNSLLHNTPPVAGAAWQSPARADIWNGDGQAHSWNNIVQSPVQQWNQWDVPALRGPVSNDLSGLGGDKYPAGVSPAACPNYPYCGTPLGAINAVAPLPGWTSRQYPAGVSPATCPNFPYCS